MIMPTILCITNLGLAGEMVYVPKNTVTQVTGVDNSDIQFG